MGFGPAVIEENGIKKLAHISASQVKNFEACPDRWYADKVEHTPNLKDWSFSQAGVAAHEILEKQLSEYAGLPYNEEKMRVWDVNVLEEAQDLVDWFSWEEYFEGHEIIAVEMDMILNLNTIADEIEYDREGDLPLFVGSMDVVSIDSDGVIVVTDWKTGYGSNFGVDIQAQAYALGIMQNMDKKDAIFRRIYPKLPGEEKGTRKVEEYYFQYSDALRYAKRIVQIAKKMRTTMEEGKPKTTPSDSCAHCPKAHKCEVLKNENFDVASLVGKKRVLAAASKQVDDALKKVANKGDFFVGEEKWGYNISTFYRAPKGGLKKEDLIPELLSKTSELLKMLKDNSEHQDLVQECLVELDIVTKNAKVSVNDDIKASLAKKGFDGYKQSARKTLAFLNEDELKELKKAQKAAESTDGEERKKDASAA